jgi:hypothetical protein
MLTAEQLPSFKMVVTIYQMTHHNSSEDLSPEPLLCRQLQRQFFNTLSHARKVPSYRPTSGLLSSQPAMCCNLCCSNSII